MISYGDSGSGIVENNSSMKLTVEHDEDDQLYNRKRDKKIATLKTEICERVYKEKWVRFCRIYLGLSEEEINYVKERLDEMYENIKKFPIEENTRLWKEKDVAEKKGFLKSKKNATPDKRQKLTDGLENKEDGEEENLEEVFKNEIIKVFLNTTKCKKISRLNKGLSLDELAIQNVVKNYKNVEEQKLKLLYLCKKRNGIVENESDMKLTVEHDEEPIDEQLNSREHDKKIAELKRVYKEKWVRFCRIYLGLSEEEINYVKERYISPDEMYENIKKFSIKENTRLWKEKDVAEKKGFLKSKKNATPDKRQKLLVDLEHKEDGEEENAMPDKLQKLVDETEDKEESEEERIEEVFQKEIIKALPGITEFKKFARVSSGLDLDELVIHDTIENYKEDVEKQKFKFLTTWKEKNGKQATNSNTRKLVANYQMGYEELKTNTGTPETSKDNTSTSDQEIFPTSDVIQAKLIYNAVSQKKKKKWQHFAQSQSGMILLEKWGAVGYDLKLQMLRYWRQTKGNTESASVTVVKLTEEFLQKKAKKGIFRNLDFDFVCDVIAKSIKDEDWLKFARVKLELRNEDIKRLRGKYAVLSEEQKYQLMKYIHE